MKQPVNTPAVLALLLVLVVLSLIGLSGYQWYESQQELVNFVYYPPQKEKVNSDKDHYYPHYQEIKSVLVNEKFSLFGNTHPIQPQPTDDLNVNEYIQRETIRESVDVQNEPTPYLVIAGTYADELFIISKQAQMQRMGLPAEIIQLGNSRYKHLCVGRYTERQQALALANILEEKHDISAFVFNKKGKTP